MHHSPREGLAVSSLRVVVPQRRCGFVNGLGKIGVWESRLKVIHLSPTQFPSLEITTENSEVGA